MRYVASHLAAWRACGRLSCRTRREVLDLQSRALRELIERAYSDVPYYRRLFDRHGVKPRHVRTVADLPIVPITAKDDLRAAPVEDTLARWACPERLVVNKTSGTSGEPFSVRRTWLEQRLSRLSWTRPARYYGLGPRDKLASLVYMAHAPGRGQPLQRRVREFLGLWRYLPVDLCLPPEEIAGILSRYRPDFLAGLPGVMSQVADHVAADGLEAVCPQAIWLGGEVLTEPVRSRISAAFAVPVYNCYASEEFGVMAWECKETGALHTYDDRMILEVIRDGRPAEPGERGEVVGTSLHSFAMPFVRYRLADVATRGAEACACGLPVSTIRELHGRVMDYFPLPDGRLLHPYDIVRVVLGAADWVRYHQLVQERRDRIVLYAVPSGEPTPEQVHRLETALGPLLGPQVAFHVVLVPGVRPGAGGKRQYSRSLVRQEGAAGTGA